MLAEALRLGTPVTSLDLGDNHLGVGGRRALVEALRLNITLASLDLVWAGIAYQMAEGGRWQSCRDTAETLRLNTTLTSRPTLARMAWASAEGGR